MSNQEPRVFLTAAARSERESFGAEVWGVRPAVAPGDVVLFYVAGRGLSHAAVAASAARRDEGVAFSVADFDPSSYRRIEPPIAFAALERHPGLQRWKPLGKPYPMTELDKRQPGPLEGPVLRAILDLVAESDPEFEVWLADQGVAVPPPGAPSTDEDRKSEPSKVGPTRTGVWITVGRPEDNKSVDLEHLEVGQQLTWAVPERCRHGDWVLFWVTGSGIRYVLEVIGEPHAVDVDEWGPVQVELAVRATLPEPVTWKMLSEYEVLKNWSLVQKRMHGAIKAQTSSLREEPALWEALQSILLELNPGAKDVFEQIEDPGGLLEPARNFISDAPALDDHLGYEPIVDALAAFLSDPETETPITVAIDAPWGAGKSSLMKMLRRRLIPDEKEPAPSDGAVWPRLSWRMLLDELKRSTTASTSGHSDDAAAPVEGKQPLRRFEAVYFNAWRHGAGDRLAASLVQHAMQEIATRQSLTGREAFWLRLHLQRLDADALRRDVYGHIARRLWSWITGATAGLVGGIATGVLRFSDTIGLVPSVLGFATSGVALVYCIWGILTKLRDEPASIEFQKYFTVPDYREIIGPQPLIEHDFESVARDLERQDKTLLVFIDDLDRCKPAQITEIVESINVFFGQTIRNCIFVLGMHRNLVATSLEIEYGRLVEKIQGNPVLTDELPFGRRFLDKIAQFVVTLPEPGEEEVDRFIHHLLGAERARPLPARVRQEADAEIEKHLDGIETNPATQERIAKQISEDHAIPVEESKQLVSERASTLRALQRARRFDERDPDAVRVFRAVRTGLRANPRQYKRFFNTLRFQYYLLAARLKKAPPSDELLRVAKGIVISLEWPDFWNVCLRSPEAFRALCLPESATDLRGSLRSLYANVPGFTPEQVDALVEEYASDRRLLDLLRAQTPGGSAGSDLSDSGVEE